MLVMFRFKNYGSFKDEAVLDMRAIKSYKEHPYHLISTSDSSSLLKTVAIYGANASGKSNLVKAYSSFLRIVCNSFRKKDKRESKTVLEEEYYPFFFDGEARGADTEFEAVFHDNGSEYQYGFIYNSKRIQYEWLYKRNLSNHRLSKILERDSEKIVLGSSVVKACEKYLADIDTDVLALSFFSSLRLRSSVFRDTLSCITELLPLTFVDDSEQGYWIERYFAEDFNEEEKKPFLTFLKSIDTGIIDVSVEKSNDKLSVYTSHLGRDKETYKYPLEIESDGTRRAIAIYSFVRIAVRFGGGLLFDELNDQLHPLLQKHIIDQFYEDNSQGQLIYTTHDTSLMDKQFMRRDQIWFVTKNQEGESSLYSLSDFKIRNDKSFEKDYLEGVYGGIPILGEFSFTEDNDGHR